MISAEAFSRHGLRYERASKPWARALLDGLSPAMRAELRVHIPHMRPDGVDRQRKLAGDLRRGQVGWQGAQNPASPPLIGSWSSLAVRQAHGTP